MWSTVIGWISAGMTSSGHFAYLSAGRSWLATFIRDRTTEKVSISPSLTRLARHPHPMLNVLALWVVHPGHHPWGECPSWLPVPQTSVRRPINSLALGAALSLLALDQILSLKFMVLLVACHLGWGCKVGHAPVSFMVLLSVQLNPVY